MRNASVRLSFCFALLMALCAPLALGQVVAPPDFERWYAIELQGRKAGHAMNRQQTGDDGNITTTSLMKLAMTRMGTTAEMTMESSFVETPGGEPVRVSFTQDLSTGTSVASTYLWEDGAIIKEVTHMGEPRRGKIPAIEMEYLTPVEIRSYVVSRIDAGDKEIKYVSLDPMSGLKPIQTVVTVEGPASVDAYGREAIALKTTSLSSNAPGVSVTELLDEQGLALYSEMKLGAMPMRMVAMTKEDALRAGEGGEPELFEPTLIRVEPGIESPRSTVGASFLLSMSEGELPDMLNEGAHAFERISPTAGRVRVDLLNPLPAPNEDFSDTRYIKATTYANTEDVRIIQMADRALADAPADRTARAEILRDYVYRFVESKNLGTGFATASDVCRTGEGDCTEHAVLLAALLRAERIPSRVVTGLIYADSFAGQDRVFGFHMWTQALLIVEGRPTWVDLDAVLPEGRAMDASHIAIQTYDLSEEGFLSSMTPVVSLLGTLRVEVESVVRE